MIESSINVRPAVAAGRHYPADPNLLRRQIGRLFSEAPPPLDNPPIAILAPHGDEAGAGPIAARAYSSIRGHGFERVIICAQSHHERFRFASVFSGEAYQTPLGRVPIDSAFTELICGSCSGARRGDLGHWPTTEHAIEVQLPYLQVAIGEFHLVPIMIGDPDESISRSLAECLASQILNSPDRTLFVASSDLSHYHRETYARRIDARTLDAITSGDAHTFLEGIRLDSYEACGAAPIATLLELAIRLGATPIAAPTYATSLQATNDPSSVVGYASLLFRRAA